MSGTPVTVCAATADMLPDLRRLWQVCFPDDEAFADLFFERRFCPEHTLVAVTPEGKPVGVLYRLPAALRCADGERPLWYGYGIGVRPDFRGRGICARMHEELYRQLEQQNTVYLLHPANDRLTAFYQTIGLTPTGRLKQVDLTFTEQGSADAEWTFVPLTAETYYSLRQARFAADEPVSWDVPALQFALDAHRLYEGEALLAVHGDEQAAVLAAVEDGVLTVTETTVSERWLPSLLEVLCRRFGVQNARVFLPETAKFDGKILSVGMGYGLPEGVSPYLNLMLD